MFGYPTGMPTSMPGSRKTRLSRIGSSVVRGLKASVPAIACLIGAGCVGTGSQGRTFDVDAGAFVGPAMHVLAEGGVHTVRVQSPTPGWDVSLDGTERTADERRLFLTLRKPDPQYLYAAVIVEQLVRTEVGTDETVAIYARVLEFAGDDDPGYRRVGPSDSDG